MMQAEQWMRLATESEAAECLTARGDQPMLPELYQANGSWRLRFWYFGLEVGNCGLEYRGLHCFLIFDRKTKSVVAFEELEGCEAGLTGSAMELIEPEYEQRQKRYLQKLDSVLEALELPGAGDDCGDPEESVMKQRTEELYELWLDTIPQLFRTTLQDKTGAVHRK